MTLHCILLLWHSWYTHSHALESICSPCKEQKTDKFKSNMEAILLVLSPAHKSPAPVMYFQLYSVLMKLAAHTIYWEWHIPCRLCVAYKKKAGLVSLLLAGGRRRRDLQRLSSVFIGGQGEGDCCGWVLLFGSHQGGEKSERQVRERREQRLQRAGSLKETSIPRDDRKLNSKWL